MTLVLVHGAAGSKMTWHLQLSHFKDAIAVELPGHPTGSGLSTIPEYADSVEGFLNKNDVKDPVIVGHSMGGAIAIELALRRLKLAALVLVGTGARLRVRSDILSKILENYEKTSKLIAKWSVSSNCDPAIVDRLAREIFKVRPEVTHGDFLACDKFDRMDDIEKISYRTLIICGADDTLTPRKYSQHLHQKIRNSKLVIIPGAGHSVMLEKHRLFNDALEAFVDSL